MDVAKPQATDTRRLHLDGAAADTATGHMDGFDPLRVLAALAMVFSHAILLSTGGEEAEPFQWLTGEILGVYGGFVFFMLSGSSCCRAIWSPTARCGPGGWGITS